MFSQTTEYALRAAAWLAESGGDPQTTRQIADATRVPPGYLAKVLQMLVRAGLLHAARGKHGGFTLARALDDVSVLDIVNSVEPIQRIRACPLGLKAHRHTLCPLHRKMDDALAAIERSFATTSLQDLMGTAGVRPLCEAGVAR